VLSVASAKISETKVFHPKKQLKCLRKTIKVGLVDKGSIGEQMVAYQYILARDRACKSAAQNSHPLLTVEKLLNELCVGGVQALEEDVGQSNADPAEREGGFSGGEQHDDLRGGKQDPEPGSKVDQTTSSMRLRSMTAADCEAMSNTKKKPRTDLPISRTANLRLLLQGLVSFVQFIEINYTPNVSDLLEAYLSGIAYCCRAGQAGIDLIIPVLLPESFEPKGYIPDSGEPAKADVFKSSESLVFDGCKFQDSNESVSIGMGMQLITDKLFGGGHGDYVKSLKAHMSSISVQVKSRNEDIPSANKYIHPNYARVVDVDGSWESPGWSKPFLAIKHVLLHPTPAVCAFPPPKKEDAADEALSLQHGLVLRGLDESIQPCLVDGVDEAMQVVLQTKYNPCATGSECRRERTVSGLMIRKKNKF